jgi:hypothetical protein
MFFTALHFESKMSVCPPFEIGPARYRSVFATVNSARFERRFTWSSSFRSARPRHFTVRVRPRVATYVITAISFQFSSSASLPGSAARLSFSPVRLSVPPPPSPV